jgi:hypothetical protein
MYQTLFDPQHQHHLRHHSYFTEKTPLLHYQEQQVHCVLQSTSVAVCYDSHKKQKADVTKDARLPPLILLAVMKNASHSKPVRYAVHYILTQAAASKAVRQQRHVVVFDSTVSRQ